jgi:hypothetical protein
MKDARWKLAATALGVWARNSESKWKTPIDQKIQGNIQERAPVGGSRLSRHGAVESIKQAIEQKEHQGRDIVFPGNQGARDNAEQKIRQL